MQQGDLMAEKDFSWLMLLKVITENTEKEWEKHRNMAAEHPRSKKIVQYFERIFKNGIKEFVLPENSTLYRARQIKNCNANEIGLTKVEREMYSIFVTEQEYTEANGYGMYISPENLSYTKIFNNLGDEESLHKINTFFEKYSKPGFYGFSARKSGNPSKQYRKDYRLSSKNDAYIYLAMDKDTAIYEMRPLIEQSYSVAEAISKKELRLANLRDVFEYKDIEDFNVSCILKKISEPNTENDVRFYYITQRLSKFIKSQGFDGILYQSSLNKDGSNIMLFNASNVKFISSSVVNIKNINVGSEISLPLNKENT